MADFDNNIFDFKIHDELNDKGIVTRYVLDSRTANIIIDLNHKYKDKRINICVKDYPHVKKLRDALKKFLVKEKGIKEEHARLLAEVIDNNADKFDDGYYAYSNINNKEKTKSSDGNNKEEDNKEKRTFTAFKYSNDNKIDLHESVILAANPCFLYYDSTDFTMKYANAIDEGTRIINPCHKESYPYTPYEFRDMDEVNAYVNRARNENIDSLHSQAKQFALDYCDQKDEKVELLAIELDRLYGHIQSSTFSPSFLTSINDVDLFSFELLILY